MLTPSAPSARPGLGRPRCRSRSFAIFSVRLFAVGQHFPGNADSTSPASARSRRRSRRRSARAHGCARPRGVGSDVMTRNSSTSPVDLIKTETDLHFHDDLLSLHVEFDLDESRRPRTRDALGTVASGVGEDRLTDTRVRAGVEDLAAPQTDGLQAFPCLSRQGGSPLGSRHARARRPAATAGPASWGAVLFLRFPHGPARPGYGRFRRVVARLRCASRSVGQLLGPSPPAVVVEVARPLEP